jgi:hypothetical protein
MWGKGLQSLLFDFGQRPRNGGSNGIHHVSLLRSKSVVCVLSIPVLLVTWFHLTPSISG